MKLTRQQFDQIVAGKTPVDGSPTKGRSKTKAAPQFKRRDPYEMNSLETEFALTYLDTRIRSGESVRYDFQPIRLVLARGLQYTPDFVEYTADGSQVFYEVKGRWMDDARAKIKVAANAYPAQFIAAMKNKKSEARVSGTWKFELIPGGGGWPIGHI